MKPERHIPDEVKAAFWKAYDEANCNGREGPYGGYDYGHNGSAPEKGRYVIRDFRYPHSKGEWVFQTNDYDLYGDTLEKLNRDHIASAALTAALAAWPGMKASPSWDLRTHERRVEIVLPLIRTEAP